MQTLDAVIGANCRRFAEKPALRCASQGGWRDVSYAELWRQVEGFASGLERWGCRTGDRVGILASSSPRWVAAYLGILRAGAVAVPIDKELKGVELRHILQDCGARLLFTEEPFLEIFEEIAADLSHLEKIVLLDDPEKPRSEGLAQIVEALTSHWRELTGKFPLPAADAARIEALLSDLSRIGAPLAAPSTPPATELLTHEEDVGRRNLAKLAPEHHGTFQGKNAPSPSPRRSDDVAVILYTSGTTGRSKGAMLSHANILSNIEAAAARFRVGENIHTLSFLPINHVYEQVCGILLPLYAGGTVSFAESIKRLGRNLAEVRPNFLLGVPVVFRLLLNRLRKSIEERPWARRLFSFPPTRPLVAARIRKSLGGNPVFISGGAPLDPEVAQGLSELGIGIYQGYGITETSPVIAFECPQENRLGTVGKPLPGVAVRIDDPNEEGIGEILVRGPNVMLGYYNNPQATAEAIVDGWYRTGDLGRLDADGYLTICGRKKNVIVTPNGKNVYPEEVEIEILKSPFIAEVMVYGHKIAPTCEEVHALIYPDQEALSALAAEQGLSYPDEARLENIIRREVNEAGRRLADYKRIRKFTLREDEFPKTTTRKIKRFAVEAESPAQEG